MSSWSWAPAPTTQNTLTPLGSFRAFDAVLLDVDGARLARAQTMTKITKRYNMQRAHSGVWSIIDMFTGQPAILDGVLLVGLKLLEADDILYELNNLDLSHRKAKGIA